MKKALALLLSLSMLFSIAAELNITAYALDSDGYCGDDIYYTFNSYDGTLSINGNGEMYDYYGEYDDYDLFSSDSPFAGNSSIKKVTIGYGVTSIGDYAFANCTGITSVTLPDTLERVGECAFWRCSALTSISIPESVTNLGYNAFNDCSSLSSIQLSSGIETIGGGAFSGCAFTSISIPYGIETIGDSAFSSCEKLQYVSIPSSVYTIESYAFSDCTALTSIEIPYSVTVLSDNVFSNCTSLSNVSLPYSIEEIQYEAFGGCTALSSIYIPENVLVIDSNAYSGCTGITSITVDSYNTVYESPDDCNAIIESKTNTLILGCKNTNIPYSVTAIGDNAFSGCAGLTSIDLSNIESIGERAFSDCTGLTSLYISSFVRTIKTEAFAGCINLSSISVDSYNTSFDSRNDCNAIINSKTDELIYGCKNSYIPDGVKKISNYAFQNCTGLTSIYIPESVVSVSYSSFENSGIWNNSWNWENNALYINDCLIAVNFDSPGELKINDGTRLIANGALSLGESPETMILPTSVTIIGDYLFGEYCGLNTVYYSGTQAQFKNIKFGIDSQFTGIEIYYSAVPETLSIDDCVIDSNGRITAYTGTASILTIPASIDGIEVTGIAKEVFYGNTTLQKIVIEDGIDTILTGAFANCTSLKSVTLPEGLKKIISQTFLNCKSLQHVTLPESLDCINSRAFENCTGLKELTIPNSVTAIETYAFIGCTNLTTITIPYNKLFNTIYSDTFNDCTKLSNVYYDGTIAEWKAIDIAEGNSCLNNANIYCSDGTIQKKTPTPTPATKPAAKTTTRPAASTAKSVSVSAVKKFKAKAAKKKLKLSWKKVSGVTGYEIQYSLKKNMKKAKKKNVKGDKKTKITIKKLKSKKKYYLRIRAYKTVSGKKYYSKWSKTIKAKVK